ncbi:hypothetical protein ABPG74_002618 [Tetrahymena malaccensis]
MDSKTIKIIQELDSHLKKRNEIKQMLRNKNISMLDSPDQTGQSFLKQTQQLSNLPENQYKNSQDENSLIQQIQILMQQGQAGNSNQINQLNQTIIQQKQQIQSLGGQVKQLQEELSKCWNENQKLASYSNQINQLNQTITQYQQYIQSLDGQFKQQQQELSQKKNENQQMNQTNIQLKEKISSLEAKLQQVMQSPQQNNSQKFEPQQAQMKINQQIQQVQPQQVVKTWKKAVRYQKCFMRIFHTNLIIKYSNLKRVNYFQNFIKYMQWVSQLNQSTKINQSSTTG